jgi:hypothetical protein
MRLRDFALSLLVLTAPLSHAQLPPDNPDWREAAAPPPPPLRLEGLIGLDLPGSALRFAVDPRSITIGADGIVRYVVVATSTSGAVNGIYEGVKCSSGEFKVYARHTPGAGWVVTKDSPWRSAYDNGIPRHTLIVARTGACQGHSANTSVEQIVRDLRAPQDTKFRQETR